jgi:tyrosyl-tRNA synthetase
MNNGKKYPAEVIGQFEELKRGVVDFHVPDELLERIASGKKLTVKVGFDPTTPDLHLGHTVLISKMKQFQDFGHRVVFVIGDFTGMIGDPTGRNETRKPLTKEEVAKNAQTYREQVFKILDPHKTEVRFNSEWNSVLNAREVIFLAARYSVGRMLERDDFRNRFREGQSISIHEFLYPLFQAYDSVALNADVELGGSDQLFNLLIGRDILRDYGQSPQIVMTMPLLEGTDAKLIEGKISGNKMSKSLGNYIGITEDPVTMFLKIMSISDGLMWRYYELLSSMRTAEITKLKEDVSGGRIHPKEAKVNLGFEIISRFHGKENACLAREKGLNWLEERKIAEEDIQVFSYSSGGREIPLYKICADTHIASSGGEAKRKIIEGAVWIGENENSMVRISDEKYLLPASGDFCIRFGRKKFIKVKISP